MLLDHDAISGHVRKHNISHKQYNEKFIQLHRKAFIEFQCKSIIKAARHEKLFPSINNTNAQSTENKYVSKRIEILPPDDSLQKKNPKASEEEDKDDREAVDDDSEEECEQEPMKESDETVRNERENEDILLSVESVISIDRFRSLISSKTGSDGKEHPAIEQILGRNAGSEDDIMEAAREYYQENTI